MSSRGWSNQLIAPALLIVNLIMHVFQHNYVLLPLQHAGEFGLVYKAHLVKIKYSENPFRISTLTQTVAVKTIKGMA